MDGAHDCSGMLLEQCQMVVCKFIAAVQLQYMHVLRQLRRGFCTIVLHLHQFLYVQNGGQLYPNPIYTIHCKKQEVT